MNAEFLERSLVVGEIEWSGGIAYAVLPDGKARKNLNAIAFIGAIVENSIHTEAYPITQAKPASSGNALKLVAGPYTLFYDPSKGLFVAVTKNK